MHRKLACFVRAWILLTAVRIALPFAGVKRVRRIQPKRQKPALEMRSILGLLRRASRWCPVGSTCLTRALAGQYLLRRAGIDSRLCIGVMRDGGKQFQAHAWLERDGKIILGGTEEEIRQWIPLSGVDERTA